MWRARVLDPRLLLTRCPYLLTWQRPWVCDCFPLGPPVQFQGVGEEPSLYEEGAVSRQLMGAGSVAWRKQCLPGSALNYSQQWELTHSPVCHLLEPSCELFLGKLPPLQSVNLTTCLRPLSSESSFFSYESPTSLSLSPVWLSPLHKLPC